MEHAPNNRELLRTTVSFEFGAVQKGINRVDLENAEDALCSCYILFWYSRERAFWSRTFDDHGEFDEPVVTKVSAKTGWTLATTLSA